MLAKLSSCETPPPGPFKRIRFCASVLLTKILPFFGCTAMLKRVVPTCRKSPPGTSAGGLCARSIVNTSDPASSAPPRRSIPLRAGAGWVRRKFDVVLRRLEPAAAGSRRKFEPHTAGDSKKRTIKRRGDLHLAEALVHEQSGVIPPVFCGMSFERTFRRLGIGLHADVRPEIVAISARRRCRQRARDTAAVAA